MLQCKIVKLHCKSKLLLNATLIASEHYYSVLVTGSLLTISFYDKRGYRRGMRFTDTKIKE